MPGSVGGELLGPVAIGGVGGSGTRLIAQLLREAGFYLGGDLNPALDNRWFTLLFKRPDWYERTLVPGDKVFGDTVETFVAAQKALLDIIVKPRHTAAVAGAPKTKPPVRRRTPVRKAPVVGQTAQAQAVVRAS